MSKLPFHFHRHRCARRERGQSMLEMALTFPILLLVLAGGLEVGKYFNDYLTLLDATREAARFAADGDINHVVVPPSDIQSCNDDYYAQAACLLLQNKYGVYFDPATDDIIVSTFTIDSTGHAVYRFPYPCSDPYSPPSGYPSVCDSAVATRDQGWSFCQHITARPGAVSPIKDPPGSDTSYHGPCQPGASFFTRDSLAALLPGDTPGTGIVIVEIYHVHHQFLGLVPPGLPFLPQAVVMHAYTMMPVPSAGPQVIP